MKITENQCDPNKEQVEQLQQKKYQILNQEQKKEIVLQCVKNEADKYYILDLSKKIGIKARNIRRWYKNGIVRKKRTGGQKYSVKALKKLSQWCIETSLIQRKRVSRQQIAQKAIELFHDPNFKACQAWQSRFIRNQDLKFRINEVLFQHNCLTQYSKNKFLKMKQKKAERIRKLQSETSITFETKIEFVNVNIESIVKVKEEKEEEEIPNTDYYNKINKINYYCNPLNSYYN